jgi:hypothetical protein
MADKKISQLPASTTPLAGTEELAVVQSGDTKKVSVANLTAGRAVSASTVLVPGNNTGITTGDPNNILRFTDTDTTTAAGQPMGRIEWVSSDAGFEGVKAYIEARATDGTPDGDLYIATQHNTGAGLSDKLKVGYFGDITALVGNLVIGTSGKGIDFSADSSAAGMTSELLDDYEEGTWTPSVTSTSGTITTVGAVSGTYTKVGRQVTVWGSIAITDNGTGAGNIAFSGLPFAVSASRHTGAGWNQSSAAILSAYVNGSSTGGNVWGYDATYPVATGQTIIFTVSYNV